MHDADLARHVDGDAPIGARRLYPERAGRRGARPRTRGPCGRPSQTARRGVVMTCPRASISTHRRFRGRRRRVCPARAAETQTAAEPRDVRLRAHRPALWRSRGARRFHPEPSWPNAKVSGMKDLGEDLERFREARARPVEVLVGLAEIDAPGADGGQPVPAGTLGQEPDFPLDALEREPARENEKDVGVRVRAAPPMRAMRSAVRPRRTGRLPRPSRRAPASSCPPP